ncbi:DNA polymerase I [Candidatus Chromulinivorax destructor]|uniref:DNA polymerase I n=1 Tax=Candidatus Chromulinivorax destructor TaxID=2066483 RepID=A0A345ZBV8_9BACT|nr:DNA polymerase I [Candidatus Chromulinivorax destructor]AXK60775.1 DNA polymerase I [Candidatus Chromulinivorax destructor]
MPTQSPVFIIDGSSFLYRAYYGMRPLQTSQGVSVQAVYSFCRMIRKIIKDFNVEHIVVVWDSKGKNVRHEIFPEYKATRQAPPVDLFEQKELILQFLTQIKMAQLSQVGIEADDLIGSLAKKFNDLGCQIMIVSGDKDLAQIVTNDAIKIFDAFKEKVVNEEQLVTQYGFPLSKLPFYFSLLGDASDNIPGVKGIGKKGATDLVIQFDSLDDLYANIDKVTKARTKELLLAQKDNAYLSLDLFTLRNYDVATTLDDTQFDEANWELTIPLLKTLEFKTLVADIEKKSVKVEQKNPSQQNLFEQAPQFLHDIYNFQLVTSLDSLLDVCAKIEAAGAFAIDTETTGLDPMVNECVGISIAIEPGTAYYIPFGHTTDEVQLPLQDLKEHLAPVFINRTIKKYLHHAKFDQVVLHQIGLPLAGVTFDTLIAASLLVQDWQKKGLKTLSEFYFDETMLTYEEMVKEFKVSNFAGISLQAATRYAAADAHQTLKLYHVFYAELEKQNLLSLFNTIEMPVNEILVAMQIEGIYCNTKILATLDTLVSQDLIKIEAEIAQYIDEPINLNSPKQIKELLFDKLNLPTQKKSAKKTGYSTDAQVLHTLSKIHPVPGLILKYRELFKLKSTYIESLPTYINSLTHKIHTSFNQALVATGRLSSSNPNLQNIPTGDLGYPMDIRSAFQAEPGHVLLAADYSQIELRILAHMSKDETLLDAFRLNKDIHTQTAAKIFDTHDSQISSTQRTVGKTINFSILYGLTSYGLSKSLEIPYKDAEKYIATYFAQYPGIVQWIDETIEFTKTHGFVTTLYGRKRYIPGIYEKNRTLFDLAKRMAINSPVQGTAAEIIKIGMINLEKNLVEHNLQAKILLQIHDELILSVPSDEVDKVSQVVKDSLESVVSWEIPLTVQIKTGLNWHDITK